MHSTDIVIILIYFIIIGFIGFLSRRKIASQNDFFLGGQRFKKFMMSMLFFGAGTHTDQVVAVVSKIYSVGFSGIWYQWLWLFTSPFYWLKLPVLRRLRRMTTADFFEERYSKNLSIGYAVIGIFTIAVDIGLMLRGTGSVIDAITLHQVPTNGAILAIAVLFVFYGVMGGLIAAVWTDALQGTLTVILSFLMIPFMLVKVGGMENLHYELEQVRGLQDVFSFITPGGISAFYVFAISLNGLVGMFTQPAVMQTGGSCKREMDGRIGSLVGTVLKRVCTVAWAFIGIGCIYMFPHLTNPDLAFGKAIHELLPVGLIGLMVASILAAVMSTCDVLMVTGTALFTRNIIKNIVKKSLTEKDFLTIGRIASVVIVIIGIIIAMLLPNILTGLELFWKLNAFTGFAFWTGLVWKRANVYGAWASIVGSIVLWLVMEIMNVSLPVQMLTYICAGFILMIAVTFLTKNRPCKNTEEFYLKLRTPVGVNPELDVIK
jgi:Na+/proline symporter